MDTRELDSFIRIRAPLRCDGVGSLDCAEDTATGMRMAVRWLPLEANGEAAAKAVETIPAHPVLPRIRSTGRVGSAAWVAMEFPEGRLLATALDSPMVPETLARIGAEVADALSALHEQGVLHGELSADSVLLLPDGRAILWDVPLVMANRITDRRGEERVLGQLLRMAPFLSPERARGLAPSKASDMYALGTLLCIAGGGVLPTAASTLAVVHQIATGQWMPELPRNLPPLMRDTVARMIEPNPLARPSARDVAAALMLVVSQTRTLQEMPAVLLPESLPIAPVVDAPVESDEAVEAIGPADLAEPVDPEQIETIDSGEPLETMVAVQIVTPPPLPNAPTVGPVVDEATVVLAPELEAQARALRVIARKRRMIGVGVLVGV
ncbi:MAG: protein kinase, partial [Myxococcaceae bacterium]